MANSSVGATSRRGVVLWQILVLAVGVGSWETYGLLVETTWFSSPSLINARLFEWASSDLHVHAMVTVGEMFAGLAIGVPLGAVMGLLIGRSPLLAALLRPLIFAMYSVPLVTLAPLFIFWFGLGMLPKIVLVALVTFFLLFFTTFSGVRTIDPDLIANFELMGASKAETFRKLIAPACMAWILSGIKIALPYSLIAATVCEMLLAREGLGFLLMSAGQQVDMTGLFAAMTVLMTVGVAVGAIANALERRLLRWRITTE